MTFLREYLRQKSKLYSKFSTDEDGVVAIEFAILLLPFLAVLFGIIELAVVFLMGSTVQSATFEASRLIRVGSFSSTSELDFKKIVCQRMNPTHTTTSITTCTDRLDVTIKRLSDFSATTSYGDGTTVSNGDSDGDNEEDPIVATVGGDTVIVSVTYTHPLTLPGSITRLSNVTGENARSIKSVTAFRNEPF